MNTAKDIILAPISSSDANAIVKRIHYSGKVVQNSTLHIGVFLGGRLEGAMQFGSPMDKRRMVGLVAGTEWDQMMELNRLAFSDKLPRNSESRALGIAMRLIRTHVPRAKWVLSFADGTQCGDGTIYRASGFVLTGIKRNSSLLRMPNGSVVARKTLDDHHDTSGRYLSAVARDNGAIPLVGYQLRYVYFLDPSWRSRLTVAEVPFSRIAEMGATMYRGERPASAPLVGDSPVQGEDGGANPTRTLHNIPRSKAVLDNGTTDEAHA